MVCGTLLIVSQVVDICGAFQKPLIKFCCSLSRFYFKKLWLLLSTYGHCTLCWGEFLWQDLRENDVIWQIFVHRHHFVCPRILVWPILRLHFILYTTAFTLLFWSHTSEGQLLFCTLTSKLNLIKLICHLLAHGFTGSWILQCTPSITYQNHISWNWKAGVRSEISMGNAIF